MNLIFAHAPCGTHLFLLMLHAYMKKSARGSWAGQKCAPRNEMCGPHGPCCLLMASSQGLQLLSGDMFRAFLHRGQEHLAEEMLALCHTEAQKIALCSASEPLEALKGAGWFPIHIVSHRPAPWSTRKQHVFARIRGAWLYSDAITWRTCLLKYVAHNHAEYSVC